MDRLTRLDDNCWSLRLERDETLPPEDPNFTNDEIDARIYGERYEVVAAAANLIHILGLRHVMESGTQFHFPSVRTLPGTWRIKVEEPESSLLHRIKQAIPFFRSISPKNIVSIKVLHTEDNSLTSLFTKIWSPETPNSPRISISELDIRNMPSITWNESATIEDRILAKPFTDAFTEVATDAFQRWEREWIPRSDPKPSCQIQLHGGHVVLQRYQGEPTNVAEEQANRRTVQAFKKFALQEYGEDILQYVQYRYRFDLDSLVDAGLPLLPEHVWRVNIGVSNLEAQDLEKMRQHLVFPA